MTPNPDRHQLAALGAHLQLERWREDFRRWAEGMDWGDGGEVKKKTKGRKKT